MRWKLNNNTKLFCQENALENVVYKMAAICFHASVCCLKTRVDIRQWSCKYNKDRTPFISPALHNWQSFEVDVLTHNKMEQTNCLWSTCPARNTTGKRRLNIGRLLITFPKPKSKSGVFLLDNSFIHSFDSLLTWWGQNGDSECEEVDLVSTVLEVCGAPNDVSSLCKTIRPTEAFDPYRTKLLFGWTPGNTTAQGDMYNVLPCPTLTVCILLAGTWVYTAWTCGGTLSCTS